MTDIEFRNLCMIAKPIDIDFDDLLSIYISFDNGVKVGITVEQEDGFCRLEFETNAEAEQRQIEWEKSKKRQEEKRRKLDNEREEFIKHLSKDQREAFFKLLNK